MITWEVIAPDIGNYFSSSTVRENASVSAKKYLFSWIFGVDTGSEIQSLNGDTYCSAIIPQNLHTIVVRGGVIYPYSFSYCKNVKKFIIGKKVKKVSINAFYECNNLTDIIVESENPYLTNKDNLFYDMETNKENLIFQKIRWVEI